jgi:hypothetical protein
VTLPLAARDRLANLILGALGQAGAREALTALAASPAARSEWLGAAAGEQAEVLAARARRAVAAVGDAPLRAGSLTLAVALEDAGRLFDAGLFFEVHELLEPFWARGVEGRDALQGLIQIAVGYQHLANGNRAGGRALLREGTARIDGASVAGVDLGGFARGVRATLTGLDASGPFDWTRVPQFPRGHR